MSKAAFFKEAVKTVERAGFELARKNKSGSHLIYQKFGSAHVVIPVKLDDPKIFYRIAKQAGLVL